MAKAEVTLKLNIDEMAYIIEAIQSYRDEHADQVSDETLTDEERHNAGRIVLTGDNILRMLSS